MRWTAGTPNRGTIAASAFIAVATVFSAGSFFHLFPRGIRGEWYWRHDLLEPSLYLLLPTLIAGAICGAYLLARAGRLASHAFLALSSLLHFLFVISFQYLYPSKLTHIVATIIHPVTTGHFQAARRFPDVSSIFTSQYTEIMPLLPIHSHTHLPGPVLCYRISIDFFRDHPGISARFTDLIGALGVSPQDLATIWQGAPHLVNAAFCMAIFYLLLLSLAVVPIYSLARELFDERVATLSIPLWIFAPATVVFFPQFDLAYPVFSAASLLFLIRYLKYGAAIDMALCGVVISAGIFLSFAFVTSILLCGITYCAYYFQDGRLRQKTPAAHTLSLAAFALPMVILYGALYWFGNIDVLEAFSMAMKINAGIQKTTSSLMWPLFFTWFDFFTFASAISSLFFLWLAYTTTRSLFKGSTQPHTYALASYLVLLSGLVFSGIVAAEVGRIWIFLVPFLVIFAAKGIDETIGWARSRVLAVLVCAFFQVVAFKMSYLVMFDQRHGFGG